MGLFGHHQDDTERDAKQQYEDAQRKLEEARRHQQLRQESLQPQPSTPSATTGTAAASSASRPLGPNDYDRYVVEMGDTLWGIARKVYGSGNDWHRIQQANPIVLKNPDVIHPGLVLRIPKAGKPLA